MVSIKKQRKKLLANMTKNESKRQFRFVQPKNDKTAYQSCAAWLCQSGAQCSRSGMRPEEAYDYGCPYLEEITPDNGN